MSKQEINVDDLMKGENTFNLIRQGDSSAIKQLIDLVKKRPEIVNVGLTYPSEIKKNRPVNVDITYPSEIKNTKTTLLHTVFTYITRIDNSSKRSSVLKELGEAIINSPEFNMGIYNETRNPLYFALENVNHPINSELQIFFAKMAAKMLNVDAEQAFNNFDMRSALWDHLGYLGTTIENDPPEDVKKIWDDEICPIKTIIEKNYRLFKNCKLGDQNSVNKFLPKSDLKGAFVFLAMNPLLSKDILEKVSADNPGLFFIQNLFPLVLADIINDYYGFQDVHKNALKKVTDTLNPSTDGSSNPIASDNSISISSLLASSMSTIMSTISSDVLSSSSITSNTLQTSRTL